MYSQALHNHLRRLDDLSNTDGMAQNLANESLACYLNVIARLTGGTSTPPSDLLETTIRLLLISDGLARLEPNPTLGGIHYLAGMGLEQSGILLSRASSLREYATSTPLSDEFWYRLLLALMHYLAGGYRVQARSVANRLEDIAGQSGKEEYQYFARIVMHFLRGKPAELEAVLRSNNQEQNVQKAHLRRLLNHVTARKAILLERLGWNDIAQWAEGRSLSQSAADFWQKYLAGLDRRGITTFTQEQLGEDNNFGWLQAVNDLLVVLPTGSGKTIIGELRTALTLAVGKQVIWILPTRALVRQTTTAMRRAFSGLDVTIDELPTTEDPIPLFVDEIGEARHIAVTTPEKLFALVRANPDAVNNVGLLVFDEAQKLNDPNRSVTIEMVMHRLHKQVDDCNYVLLTAFDELLESLKIFTGELLGREPVVLHSENRPTRRIYGVLTYEGRSPQCFPKILVYPPQLQAIDGQTKKPHIISFPKPLPKTAQNKPLEMTKRFLKPAVGRPLRTVVFVSRTDSTETQALNLASSKNPVALPNSSLARLRLELGRESVIQQTGPHGVVPHHGRLTPLEQSLAEQWVRDGVVNTVVATTTLADGINLPFDLAILTFLKHTGQYARKLSNREIMNMIGRAGRAGYASDGLGLIVQKNFGREAVHVLDGNRRFFFGARTPTRDELGLAVLATHDALPMLQESEWLLELDHLTFAEAQHMISFLAQFEQNAGIADVLAELASYPSIKQLSEQQVNLAAEKFAAIIANLRQVIEAETVPRELFIKTGMPPEVLQIFAQAIVDAPRERLESSDSSAISLWADSVVLLMLEQCASRKWCETLLDGLDPAVLIKIVQLWRLGAPLRTVEATWPEPLAPLHSKKARLAVGRFLRQRLSLLTQFWGALAACYQQVHEGKDDLSTQLLALPVFTREGVDTFEKLEWLRVIGGVDRVLAHELANATAIVGKGSKSRKQIRTQISRWALGREPLPSRLSEPAKAGFQALVTDRMISS